MAQKEKKKVDKESEKLQKEIDEVVNSKVDKKKDKKATKKETKEETKKESKKEVKKDNKKKEKKTEVKKESFWYGVKSEFKKVRWPSRKEMIKYSVATISFVIFFALFFYIIELIAYGVKLWKNSGM